MTQQNALLSALTTLMKNYVDKDGLLYFKNKLDTIFAKKADIPTKTSQLNNDSGYQTSTELNNTLKSYAKTSEVPHNTSQLNNDSGFITSIPVEYVTESELNAKGYQTSSQVESAITSKGYQTQAQVQAMVNNAQHMKREVVSVLPQPTSANELTIYLVANSQGTYDEYMLINGKMDKIGGTDMDLQGYYNENNFTPVPNGEIDKLFQ